MTVIFFMDGVLRKESDKSPILDGVSLFKSVNDRTLTRIIVKDKVEAERWMKMHNMAKRIDDFVTEAHPGLEDEDLRKIYYCRSQGKIDYVVTDRVDLAKALLEQGITSYLFLSPKYMRPEFRPDTRSGKKSWADIESELDHQQELFVEDPRL